MENPPDQPAELDFEDAPQVDEDQRNQQLIELIDECSRKAGKNERMTWNALHSLKKQEMEINARMNEEIDKIKDRYQRKKEELQKQVTRAVMGQCEIDEESKVQPAALPDFWRAVFEVTGMLVDEQDASCMEVLSEFTCDYESQQKTTRLRFVFKEETPLFDNKELSIEVTQQEESYRVNVPQPLRLKKGKGGNSFFSELFGGGESGEVARIVREIYQNYMNCVYFYLQSCKAEGQTDEQGSASSSPRKRVKL